MMTWTSTSTWNQPSGPYPTWQDAIRAAHGILKQGVDGKPRIFRRADGWIVSYRPRWVTINWSDSGALPA